MRDHLILLNPGPVTLSERVRKALLRPDLCHREAEFAELQARIRAKLLEVYDLDPGSWAAVLLTGSGTAALEAMVSSLVPEEGKLLVLENGVYGERLSRIAAIHGIARLAQHHEWGEGLDLPGLERLLEENRGITHLAVVQHETTTGRLNDLAALAARCRPHGVQLLVDAVSSFGGEALDFEGWGLGACAATANKCLHGVPGASFVIVRRQVLDVGCPRTLYLDLGVYCREQDRGGTPFTQAVPAFYALEEALSEFQDEGGWMARHRRYAALASLVRRGLIGLGIRPLLPEGASSVVLNAYHLPDGMEYETLHDRLKERGFVIYAGQGGLARRVFRVSTMGAIAREDMERFLDAVKGIVSRSL